MKAKLAIAVVLAVPLSAHPRWLRWASAVAVCVTSGLDMATTAYAVHQGAVEQDRILVHDGKLSLGRLIAINSLSCGGAIAATASHRLPSKAIAPLNFGVSAVKAWAGISNIGVLLKSHPTSQLVPLR